MVYIQNSKIYHKSPQISAPFPNSYIKKNYNNSFHTHLLLMKKLQIITKTSFIFLPDFTQIKASMPSFKLTILICYRQFL